MNKIKKGDIVRLVKSADVNDNCIGCISRVIKYNKGFIGKPCWTCQPLKPCDCHGEYTCDFYKYQGDVLEKVSAIEKELYDKEI